MNSQPDKKLFTQKFYQRYQGIMDWDAFEQFWQTLTKQSNHWYYYDTQNTLPKELSADIKNQLTTIYQTIKQLHQARYCGLVYVDHLTTPTLIKIFHPNNLGKSCGSSESPPLPRWVLSKIQPIDILAEFGKPVKKIGWLGKLLTI